MVLLYLERTINSIRDAGVDDSRNSVRTGISRTRRIIRTEEIKIGFNRLLMVY